MGVLRRILSRAKALHVFLSFRSLPQAVYSMLIGGSSFPDDGQPQWNKIPVRNSPNDAVGIRLIKSRTCRHPSSTIHWYIISRRKSDIYLKMVCMF
jgi:hypothetical protein